MQTFDCQSLTLGLTLADCEALVASSVVVGLADEGPFETFDRLGLVMVEA